MKQCIFCKGLGTVSPSFAYAMEGLDYDYSDIKKVKSCLEQYVFPLEKPKQVDFYEIIVDISGLPDGVKCLLTTGHHEAISDEQECPICNSMCSLDDNDYDSWCNILSSIINDKLDTPEESRKPEPQKKKETAEESKLKRIRNLVDVLCRDKDMFDKILNKMDRGAFEHFWNVARDLHHARGMDQFNATGHLNYLDNSNILHLSRYYDDSDLINMTP